MSKRWLPGLVFLLVPLLPRTAGAQQEVAPPAVLPPPYAPAPARLPPAELPQVEREEPEPEPVREPVRVAEVPRVAPRIQRDHDAVFRAFNVFVQQERASRVTSALGGVAMGGVVMGVGGWAAHRTRTTQTPWFAAGGALAGLSTLALIIPGPAENVASRMRTGEAGHTEGEARALEAEWRRLAESARIGRQVGAAVGLVLGAGAIGTGIGIASGAGDLNRNDRTVVGATLIGTGAGVLFAGAATLFMKSPAESSYAQYWATKSAPRPVDFSLAAGPAGFSLGARGTF
jgi:hypothetical protein